MPAARLGVLMTFGRIALVCLLSMAAGVLLDFPTAFAGQKIRNSLPEFSGVHSPILSRQCRVQARSNDAAQSHCRAVRADAARAVMVNTAHHRN